MKIAKTTYEKLGYQDCPRCFPGEMVEATDGEVISYLNQDADHAILLSGQSGFIAVWRGWRGDLNNFYVQALPLESKADAIGGDVNSAWALTTAQVLAQLALIPEAEHAEGVGNS
jgi:hypothetical protein